MEANNYELKNFKILGYTTDFQQCECCGKENLKGTVSILDLNSDVVLHFGTTCAVNANKYDSLEAAKKAKKEVDSLKRIMVDAEKFARVQLSGRRYKMEYGVMFEKIVQAYVAYQSILENRLKFTSLDFFINTIS